VLRADACSSILQYDAKPGWLFAAVGPDTMIMILNLMQHIKSADVRIYCPCHNLTDDAKPELG
jgi:hypothetical protein